MKSTPMRREFSFNGLKLPDPNPQMSVEDVRGVLALQYPEIATAAITGPEPVGDILKYSFERAIEIRGESAFFRRLRRSSFLRLNAAFSRDPVGERRRARIFVELGIWLARICFQNRLSHWAG